jgi:hypothetical protein
LIPTALAMFYSTSILPVCFGPAITPHCPIPIGQRRSVIRPKRFSGVVSSLSLLAEYISFGPINRVLNGLFLGGKKDFKDGDYPGRRKRIEA